jgi:NADPH-dependent ferric siderophore reductase
VLLAAVTVRSVERLSPSFVRIELGGPALADLGVDGPWYDQRFKLLLPTAAGLQALDAATWWSDLQALPDDRRPAVRTYTVREVRGCGTDTRLVVDVALHDDAHGPGSAWAASARVGDEAMVVAPRRGTPFGGIEWDPGPAERLLIVGDETAVPAIASILGSLPPTARGAAFLEVPLAADVQRLRAPAGVTVRWLPREGAPVGSVVVDAVRAHLGLGSDGAPDGAARDRSDEPAACDGADELFWETPTHSSTGEVLDEQSPVDGEADDRYAWIAGETGLVTALRRHLVADLGLPRRQVAFMGYWREGVAMRG